ncbi:MAG TPA: hypothetical protein VFA68_16990 [Terriglobales bacterium]|nr:hypothetical protein [Terriglobales bacterium]
MEEPLQRRFPVRGTAALIVAIAVIMVPFVLLPAYRIFFLVSLGIGIVVAGILYLWRMYRPIREEDIHNTKRPLGLD